MEPGESLEQTARRELLEETGLQAEELQLRNLLSGEDYYFKYPNGDEVYNVIGVYEAINPYGKLVMEDGESLALKYFPLHDLPEIMDYRARLIIKKTLL